MNDDGVVAFAVGGTCPNLGAAAIWKTSGGAIDVVHDICTQPGFTTVVRPSISNTGAAAFMAASAGSYDHVVRVKDGALVTIAGPGTVTQSDIGTLTSALDPAINNSDVVTFLGQGPLNYGLFTGTGGSPTLISLDTPSAVNGISDSGQVAFIAAGAAVKTSDGVSETTVATVGAYQTLFAGAVAASASGRVAFLAQLPSGEMGVFTGPDPNADVVLKTGQVIVGFGEVTGMSIYREAINDSGQVAMLVHFDDEGVWKVAIVRADPPNTAPIATDASVSVAAGGTVSGTLDGTDADGEPFTFAIVANGSKGMAVIEDAPGDRCTRPDLEPRHRHGAHPADVRVRGRCHQFHPAHEAEGQEEYRHHADAAPEQHVGDAAGWTNLAGARFPRPGRDDVDERLGHDCV
jgi:hypothetical protein